MRVILAHPASGGEGFDRGRKRIRAAGVIIHALADTPHKLVQPIQRILRNTVGETSSKIPDLGVQRCLCRIPQKDLKRQFAVLARQDAICLRRHNFAVCDDIDAVPRFVDDQHVRDIPECIGPGAEPGSRLNTPTDKMLAYVRARRQPDDLRRENRWVLVQVGRLMSDVEAHFSYRTIMKSRASCWPTWALPSMNVVRNSCRPVAKISSMRW